MSSEKLLVRPSPVPKDAGCRLVCFPWAGGGAAYFIGWARKMIPDIEVVALRLPGRESRFKEPCYKNIDTAVGEITDAIGQNLLDKPLAFFGHSLGSLISFDVALRLKKVYGVSPIQMFVSGMSAPHSSQVQEKERVSTFSDTEFLAYMKSLGGTPPEVLQNEEMMSMFLPILRADYSLYEQFTYELPPSKPLSCPIHIFDGKDDKKHDLAGWGDVTMEETHCSILPGGHFYLKEGINQTKIIIHITSCLNDQVRQSDQPV